MGTVLYFYDLHGLPRPSPRTRMGPWMPDNCFDEVFDTNQTGTS